METQPEQCVNCVEHGYTRPYEALQLSTRGYSSINRRPELFSRWTVPTLYSTLCRPPHIYDTEGNIVQRNMLLEIHRLKQFLSNCTCLPFSRWISSKTTHFTCLVSTSFQTPEIFQFSKTSNTSASCISTGTQMTSIACLANLINCGLTRQPLFIAPTTPEIWKMSHSNLKRLYPYTRVYFRTLSDGLDHVTSPVAC